MKYFYFSCIILFIFILSNQARADYLPEILTIQDPNYNVIGYINTDGRVMDKNYKPIGYIRDEGRMEDLKLNSIGYFDGNNFQDENFNIIASFSQNRIQSLNFCPLGYIENGQIEGQDFKMMGYFIGNTQGKNWVIAAFCLYYTNIFNFRQDLK
jgi:hypothetical protein